MRILLADDAVLLREGLAGLLTAAGHEVVAQVADADALRAEVARLMAEGEPPDAVVTDVRMPPTRTDDGLRAAIDLRASHPGLPVVVLSAYVAGPYLGELLEGDDGSVGYLLKERVGRVSDFLRSLDVVVSGGVVIDPEVLAHLMTAGAGTAHSTAGAGTAHSTAGAGTAHSTAGAGTAHNTAGYDEATDPPAGREDRDGPQLGRLTPREAEVITLMAEGLSNRQIAERLVLSDGAVAKHVANVFLKLDLLPGEENRRVRAVLTWLRAHA